MDHNVAGPGQQGRLDATGQREVVFCHQCDNEWWQDEHGLVCPRCEGEITEIVSPGSDPRPDIRSPSPPPDIQSLQDHHPWGHAGHDSDPEEADIEEHVTHNPNGSVRFTRTVRSSMPMFPGGQRRRDPMGEATRGPPGPPGSEDPDAVMRNFQDMIGNLVGPQLRHGQPGRSGPDTLFNPPPVFQNSFRMGGGGSATIMGGRVTYTSGTGQRTQNFGARDPNNGPPDNDLSAYASPSPSNPPNGRSMYIISIRARPDHLASILGSLFGGAPGGHNAHGGGDMGAMGGMPPGLQGLFAAMLNPANARSGDAVYTQEALDQIISTLMEQHPTSNAPGPASPDAIAALPKKNLTEKELGPEGKGECSVCMDDVKLGDEVISLPCAHWFHEACASMWLGEHNTCPICRKGIDASPSPTPTETPSGRRTSQTPSTSRNEHRARRLSLSSHRSRSSRDTPNANAASARNEARLDAIRSTAGLSSGLDDANPSNRWSSRHSPPPRIPHESRPNTDNARSEQDYAGPMPGSFFRRPSDMSDRNRDQDGAGERRRSISRRSSQSGSGGSGNSGGGGVTGWLRDRFSGGPAR